MTMWGNWDHLNLEGKFASLRSVIDQADDRYWRDQEAMRGRHSAVMSLRHKIEVLEEKVKALVAQKEGAKE